MLRAKQAKELASGKPTRLLTVAPDTSVKRALELMRESKIHHLVVLREGKYLGTVCLKDLVGDAAAADWFGAGRSVTVGEVMRMGVPVITEDTDVRTVLSFMLRDGLTALPMSQGGKITGIITETDLLRLLERLVEKHSGLSEAIQRGEAAVANPLIQNFMKALGDAGI